MTDALGWRRKFGVIAPSTNTIVEPDFYAMTVPGVTAHFSRIHIRDQDLSDDANFENLLVQIRDEIGAACERVRGDVHDGHAVQRAFGGGHADTITTLFP